MNVLVIPEDFRKDQYLLKPLFQALFESLGWRNTKVNVCNPPLLQGVTEALKSERLGEVVERYEGMVDVFILCVDRDGILGRRSRLNQIETEFGERRVFLAENAWEELETWVLAGLDLPTEWRWRDVRSEISVKEMYFEQLAALMGLSDGPGGGRKVLGIQAARRLDAIIAKCGEDFGVLVTRIRALPQLVR